MGFVEDEPVIEGETVTGNYLDKLNVLYDTGVINTKMSIQIVHEETCSSSDPWTPVCDCKAQILANGKPVESHGRT